MLQNPTKLLQLTSRVALYCCSSEHCPNPGMPITDHGDAIDRCMEACENAYKDMWEISSSYPVPPLVTVPASPLHQNDARL